MNDTTQGALKAMQSALEGAGIAIGEVLMPMIIDLANFVKDLATRFRELDEGTQKTIVVIGAVVAAIGPLLMIIPSLIGGIQMVSTAIMAMNPMVLAAVAAVGAAAVASLPGVAMKTAAATHRSEPLVVATLGARGRALLLLALDGALCDGRAAVERPLAEQGEGHLTLEDAPGNPKRARLDDEEDAKVGPDVDEVARAHRDAGAEGEVE